MRTMCDGCESAAAVVFCAADEAALCRTCDEKVHLCNKLASRHVRVGLADPSTVPQCDICENAPAFFYCEIDGSSLCLQCDMIVHVGGKRKHGRYLVLRQRVEYTPNGNSFNELIADMHLENYEVQPNGNSFNEPIVDKHIEHYEVLLLPNGNKGDKPGHVDEPSLQPGETGEARRDKSQPAKPMMRENPQNHRIPTIPSQANNGDGISNTMFDLNTRPQRMRGQTSNNQEQIMDISNEANNEPVSVVPVVSFQREFEK